MQFGAITGRHGGSRSRRSLSLGARAFRAAARGHSLSGNSEGASLRYRLSEPATVAFAVEVAEPRRRARLPGGFTRPSGSGTNRVHFSGRLGGRRLLPGRYRLVAMAKDAAENDSTVERTHFAIVR